YRPPSSRNSPSLHTNLSPTSSPTSFHSQTPSPSINEFEDFYSDNDDNYPQDQDQHDFYSEEDNDQYEDNNCNNDYRESTYNNEDDWDYQ
ncbi:hypothetical protein K443DRAFT_11144, partial [Laccaria amethystina LaAM-08-1]